MKYGQQYPKLVERGHVFSCEKNISLEKDEDGQLIYLFCVSREMHVLSCIMSCIQIRVMNMQRVSSSARTRYHCRRRLASVISPGGANLRRLHYRRASTCSRWRLITLLSNLARHSRGVALSLRRRRQIQ